MAIVLINFFLFADLNGIQRRVRCSREQDIEFRAHAHFLKKKLKQISRGQTA
jgi:hypothetical protein